MQLERPKEKIDKNKKAFNENRSEIINVLKQNPEGLTRTALKNNTTIKSYQTIRKHVKCLIEEGQIIEEDKKLVSIEHYIDRVGKSLEELTNELQRIIDAASKKENIRRFEKESAYVPSKEAHRIGRIPFTELRGLLNRNKELRRVFGDLAWILVRSEGDKLAKEDLSNVRCNFFNRYPNFAIKNSETRKLKGGGTLTVEGKTPLLIPVEFEEIDYWMKRLREEKDMNQKQEGTS